MLLPACHPERSKSIREANRLRSRRTASVPARPWTYQGIPQMAVVALCDDKIIPGEVSGMVELQGILRPRLVFRKAKDKSSLRMTIEE